MSFTRLQLDGLTQKAIGCAYTVSNVLGSGFLEKVYENAFAHELRKTKAQVKQQHPIDVIYDGTVVGEFFADLVVDDAVLIELKAVKELDDVHLAQCMNYLKATGLKVCLLMNFAKPKVEVKRVVNNY
jgi:GxxExxY protein